MSPGGFSLRLLVPVFLRRRSKKYEKLETEDPEKKKQEATLDELVRINFKIDKLVNSMTKEDFESATGPEDECLSCGEFRAVMQVSPCQHQALCRLCFVKNIRQAVSTRQLPLCCVICACKIQRVKNNYKGTALSNRRPLPSSVSGYELSSLSKSASNYSVHSASSCGSTRSVRSSGSFRSLSSVRSSGSSSSWFSVNSLSSFQCGGLDKTSNTKPRPHSLTGSGRHRLSYNPSSSKTIPHSASSPSIRNIARETRSKVPNSQSAQNLSSFLPPSPSSPQHSRVSTTGSSSDMSSLGPSNSQDNRGLEQQQQQQQQQQQHSIKVGRRDNIYSRKKVKSPDLLETTFTMSTIEEEMEGVNIGHSGQTVQ